MHRHEILSDLAQVNDRKIVLLILDGLGDIRNAQQPKTALEAANSPHLDALAARSALGRLVPVLQGVTPGSGPGHLGLFGYDPTEKSVDIGRGVLEALGLGLDLDDRTVAARANFASLDADGKLTDRRAGRIPSEEGHRLCARLREMLEQRGRELSQGLEIEVHPGEGYRFVLLARGEGLSAELEDTDPQKLGVAPRSLEPSDGAGTAASETVARLEPVVQAMFETLSDEPKANGFLLRGFSSPPSLPGFQDLYKLTAGCFAGYPLYRGVASTCGMEVVECGKRIADLLDQVEARWSDFDFFFLHVKQTDQAGEDGDLATKAAVIEEVDAELPRLLGLGPDVVAITGDHSTPSPMKAHSWHPIPLLLHGPNCFIDATERFDELETVRGAIGTIQSHELMGLLLGNAGKLAKFGA